MLVHPLSRHETYGPLRVPQEGNGPFSDDAAPDAASADAISETNPPEKRKRHRSLKRRIAIVAGILLCAIVLVLGIAVGVILFMTRDTASPYRVGQALEQFRLLQTRAGDRITKTFGRLPALGVYMYSTSGSESANAPGLPTSTSRYPGATTLTIFSDACGQDWRWQPLTNRYEDLVVCRSSGGALMLQSRYDEAEFYGVTDRRNFSCTAGSVFLPSDAGVGDAVGGTCVNGGNRNSGGMTIAYSGKVIRDDILVVGGADVGTVQLALDETMTGDTVGTGTVDLWLDASNGMIVKESRTETTRSDSAVGWVPSTEKISLALDSLTPRQ